MKLKTLLFVGAFVLATSGSASAKVAAVGLTVDGPGMLSAGVVREGRLLYRVSSVLLFNGNRSRTQPPLTPGPAYVLAYDFGLHDEDGSRTETVHQTLYPFASGGPVVFTEKRQRIEMTYGPVRFASGWFKVPPLILRRLQHAGLPTTPPGPEIVANERTAAPPDARPGWPWLLGVGALATAAGTACSLPARSGRGRRVG